jgi:hypothetical protein
MRTIDDEEDLKANQEMAQFGGDTDEGTEIVGGVCGQTVLDISESGKPLYCICGRELMYGTWCEW